MEPVGAKHWVQWDPAASPRMRWCLQSRCARTQSLGCKGNDCAYFLFVQHHPGSGGLGFLDHVESRSQIQGVLVVRVTEEVGSETATVILGLGDTA